MRKRAQNHRSVKFIKVLSPNGVVAKVFELDDQGKLKDKMLCQNPKRKVVTSEVVSIVPKFIHPTPADMERVNSYLADHGNILTADFLNSLACNLRALQYAINSIKSNTKVHATISDEEISRLDKNMIAQLSDRTLQRNFTYSQLDLIDRSLSIRVRDYRRIHSRVVEAGTQETPPAESTQESIASEKPPLASDSPFNFGGDDIFGDYMPGDDGFFI